LGLLHVSLRYEQWTLGTEPFACRDISLRVLMLHLYKRQKLKFTMTCKVDYTYITQLKLLPTLKSFCLLRTFMHMVSW